MTPLAIVGSLTLDGGWWVIVNTIVNIIIPNLTYLKPLRANKIRKSVLQRITKRNGPPSNGMRSFATYLPVRCCDLHIEASRGRQCTGTQCINRHERSDTKSVLSANRRCLSARLFQPYADAWIAYQADAELSIKCRMIWSSSTIKANCCISRTLKRQKWTTIVDLANVD